MNGKSKYDSAIHHRHSIRLQGYDYSQNGAYFVTICTRKKEHVFGKIVKNNSSCPGLVLSAAGRIAEQCWLEISCHSPDVMIDEYVIMPNHVHGIIVINNQKNSVYAVNGRGTACRAPTGSIEKFGKPTAGTIPTIIRSCKSAVTKRINEIRHTPGNKIWQRNYYEHVVRNENDLYDNRKYINENPLKWDMDEYYT